MREKTTLRSFWRWTFWPALVVTALNIETLAQRLGADQILTWAIGRGDPVLSGVVTVLTSDAALHIALLFAGGGLFAWSDYLAKKTPWRLNPYTRAKWVCRNGALIIERSFPDHPNELAFEWERVSYNVQLVRVQPLPQIDPTNVSEVRRGVLCLRAIASLIGERQIATANAVAEMILMAPLDEPIEPPLRMFGSVSVTPIAASFSTS
jgi:hypothetical protein